MIINVSSTSPGCFIAMTGVMGVGKSSLTRALAEKIGYHAFIEPEAEAWPVPANECWEDHAFKLEQWVRETNHALFLQAKLTAASSVGALADGGLFVLAKEYMDDPACGFYYDLFTPDEKLQLQIGAQSDWKNAPVPDVLVVVEADVELWKLFLKKRARSMDANQRFIENYEGQQRAIRSAAEKYAQEKNVRLTVFKLQSVDLDDNTAALFDLLVESGVICERA